MPEVRHTRSWLTGVVLWACLSAPTQAAEGDARCLVLGPLAVSAYVAMMETVAARDPGAVAERADSAANLIELYDRLGCPLPALRAAVECLSATLIDPNTNNQPTDRSRKGVRALFMKDGATSRR